MSTVTTPLSEFQELVPARMLNEYTYCPRLCYMEWVQGEFVHSADTLDGRLQHRRVDRDSGSLPDPDSTSDDEPRNTPCPFGPSLRR